MKQDFIEKGLVVGSDRYLITNFCGAWVSVDDGNSELEPKDDDFP